VASAVPFLTLEQFEQIYEGQKPYYEYWFGEAIQKSMPTSLHGVTQGVLFMMLITRGWRASCEVKLKISSFANPLPDVVGDPGPIESPYPTKPFALCVEILSPDDDLTRLIQKCAHYLDWGIETVWIIDPERRKGYSMTRSEPRPAQLFLSDSLSAEPGLFLPMQELFEQIDRLASEPGA
jgi:Uma2 family endonuclease